MKLFLIIFSVMTIPTFGQKMSNYFDSIPNQHYWSIQACNVDSSFLDLDSIYLVRKSYPLKKKCNSKSEVPGPDAEFQFGGDGSFDFHFNPRITEINGNKLVISERRSGTFEFNYQTYDLTLKVLKNLPRKFHLIENKENLLLIRKKN